MIVLKCKFHQGYVWPFPILLMAIVLGPKYDSCMFDIGCTHSHLYVDKLNELNC